jgi:hypothetical protein
VGWPLSNDLRSVQRKELDTLVLLELSCSRSIAAYLGIYKDAYNYRSLEDELKDLMVLYTDRYLSICSERNACRLLRPKA